jgi:hypothetical protein
LAEAERPKLLRIVRNGTGHGPKDLVPCRPLASTDLLFKIFANTATTPVGALDFVARFGPLTPEGWDARHGDQVSLVTFNAEYMRELLRVWAGKQKEPHFTTRPTTVSPRRPLAVQPHDTGPSSSLNARVAWDHATKSLKWELRPTSLLDALWLQLAQSLTSGAQFRQCEHCGEFFVAGRGTGRRVDAKFCSEEHKIAFHSLKRSREE